jgi:hypothetical protein
MNPTLFSSAALHESSGKNSGPNISEMDPPQDTKYRAHMQRGFMRKLVASWTETIVRPVLARHFDAIKKKGDTYLVRELTAMVQRPNADGRIWDDSEPASLLNECSLTAGSQTNAPAGAGPVS